MSGTQSTLEDTTMTQDNATETDAPDEDEETVEDLPDFDEYMAEDPEDETEDEGTTTWAEFDLPLPGMVARDREDGGKVVVISRTGMTAEEDMIAATGKTVAEHNPEYPADAPTVLVSYKGNLEDRWPEKWAEWPASMLTYMVGNAGEATFSFPAPRLMFGAEFMEDELERAEDEGEEVPEPEAGVSCTACDWHEDPETVAATYALHNEACPECGAPVREVITDGGEVKTAKPDETLRLTDEGLQMPDMLKGYVGTFKLRTADITGEFTTTDSGLPETEYYDGVISAYPEDDGDYNPHLEEGLLSFETESHPERVFRIVDERTDETAEDEEVEA